MKMFKEIKSRIFIFILTISVSIPSSSTLAGVTGCWGPAQCINLSAWGTSTWTPIGSGFNSSGQDYYNHYHDYGYASGGGPDSTVGTDYVTKDLKYNDRCRISGKNDGYARPYSEIFENGFEIKSHIKVYDPKIGKFVGKVNYSAGEKYFCLD
jgi:hypothetical protein